METVATARWYARDLIKKLVPMLMLMLKMPRMDGLDFLEINAFVHAACDGYIKDQKSRLQAKVH